MLAQPFILSSQPRVKWAAKAEDDVISPTGAILATATYFNSGTIRVIDQQIPSLIGRILHKYILVLSADHIYKMDYNHMLKAHIDSGADIILGVLGVPLEDANRFGLVQMDDTGKTGCR